MSAKNKGGALTPALNNNVQVESYHDKRQAAIEKRRADIPKAYQRIYDRAVHGKSLRAAAKAFCLECTMWQKEEVRLCTSLACPLYPYRAYQGCSPSAKNRGFSNKTEAGEGVVDAMSQASENPVLKAALEYHGRGWCVIPLPYGQKKAVIKWKPYQTSRPDENQLVQWFGNGKANIAVVFGEVSGGLACRDFDTMAEYDKWMAKYPELAKMLPTVKTAKGMHVYFEGHIEGIKHIANGELRGSGGYCLLPPSLHPDGIEYEWINPVFNGNLLCVDPILAGFVPDGTEQTEHTEQSEQTEQSEAISGGVIEKMILDTLPQSFGTRNRQIFEFVRALKSLPQYADADTVVFRGIVRKWHNQALPKIRTKEFDETWIDFLKGWGRVKYPKGKEPMAVMFERAITLEPPKMVMKLHPDSPKLQILASVCRELQKAAGGAPFFLSVRTAAQYLNVSPIQANRYLYLLVQEKILHEVSKGGTAQMPRQASRYKFIAN